MSEVGFLCTACSDLRAAFSQLVGLSQPSPLLPRPHGRVWFAHISGLQCAIRPRPRWKWTVCSKDFYFLTLAKKEKGVPQRCESSPQEGCGGRGSLGLASLKSVERGSSLTCLYSGYTLKSLSVPPRPQTPTLLSALAGLPSHCCSAPNIPTGFFS